MPRTSALAQSARVEPSAELREAVNEVVERTSERSAEFILRYADGSEAPVPSQLVVVLMTAAGELSAGHAVTIRASETLLTPTEVGQLLGLSRPFVARLLDDGTIPSTNLPGSSHRVVRLDDVLAFAERRRRRQEGRRRIADAVDEADLPY
jgi:excisionase family DNA binding protein